MKSIKTMNDNPVTPPRSVGAVSRRRFLGSSTAALAGGATALSTGAVEPAQAGPLPAEPIQAEIPGPDYRIQNGRVRQSVMGWCFNPMSTGELIDECHRMGMPAMEGISRQHYPRLKELGMVPAIVGSHGFANGPVDPDNRSMCVDKLREAIDVAVEFGAPNVITFTGMRKEGVSDERAARLCVDCWKQVMAHAERRGVNVCLEHLNSRDASHPMKGHPGYFGDDVELCLDLVRRVSSPRMKLLFDIYHVQVMNGDVIRRIRKNIDAIGHVHTAGVPGRGEIDATQELHYPAIMRALLDSGYKGFVAQEFIPTWDDKLGSLRHGVRTCDV